MAIQGTTFFNTSGGFSDIQNVQGGHNGLPHKIKSGIGIEGLPYSGYQEDVAYLEYSPNLAGNMNAREAVNTVTTYSVGGWASRWSGIDSNDYHIVYIDSSGDVYHCIASTVSDSTYTTATYSTPVLVFNGTSGIVGAMRVNVCLSTSGYIYVEGHIDGTSERFFYVSTDGGATFSTTGVNIHENGTGDKAIMCPAWGSGDGNDIMFAYFDASFGTGDISIKFFDHSAGTVTETAVDSTITLGLYTTQTQNQISFISDPDAQKNYLAYWVDPDTATTDLRFWEIDYNSATAKTDVTSSSGGNQGAVGISVEAATGDIYVVYAGKDDGTSEYDLTLINLDLMYKFSKDGGTTWSAERALCSKNITNSTDYFKFLLVCPYLPSTRFEADPPVYILSMTDAIYQVQIQRVAIRQSAPDQFNIIKGAQRIQPSVSNAGAAIFQGSDSQYLVEDWTTGNILAFSKGHDNDIYIAISNDGGLTWDNDNMVAGINSSHFSIWYDRWSGIADDTVHILYTENNADDTSYMQYDFSTNAFTTPVVVHNGATSANNEGRSYITQTEDGTLWAAGYQRDTSENYSYYSTDDGATWTTTSITSQLASADDYSIAVPALGSATDDFVGIRYDSSAGTLDAQLWDVSAVSSSTGSLLTGLGTVLQSAPVPPNIGIALDRTNDLIYVACSDDLYGGGDIQIIEIDVSSGSISATTQGSITNVLGTSYMMAALSIDANGVLYCFTGEGTLGGSSDAHEWQSTDAGVTWKFIRVVDNAYIVKKMLSVPCLNGTAYGTNNNPWIPVGCTENVSNGLHFYTYMNGYVMNLGQYATNW